MLSPEVRERIRLDVAVEMPHATIERALAEYDRRLAEAQAVARDADRIGAERREAVAAHQARLAGLDGERSAMQAACGERLGHVKQRGTGWGDSDDGELCLVCGWTSG